MSSLPATPGSAALTFCCIETLSQWFPSASLFPHLGTGPVTPEPLQDSLAEKTRPSREAAGREAASVTPGPHPLCPESRVISGKSKGARLSCHCTARAPEHGAPQEWVNKACPSRATEHYSAVKGNDAPTHAATRTNPETVTLSLKKPDT